MTLFGDHGAQKTFFTIHYNLYKSPLNRETAKRLVERMVSVYNEKFAAGLIFNEPVLNEIDSSDFQLFEQVNSYSLYNFMGLITSLEAKNNQLVAVKFSKNGFNPAVISNRLNALVFGVRQIISSITEYNAFIRSYNADFQRQVVSVLSIGVVNPGRIFRPFLFGMILICSVGLTLRAYYLYFSLRNEESEQRNLHPKKDVLKKEVLESL